MAVRPFERAADPGLDCEDEEEEGQGVMAQSDQNPACEPGAIRA